MGLDASASLDEVRSAFRHLARRFHPDLNPDDPRAAATFRKIREAFEELNSKSRIERHRKDVTHNLPAIIPKKRDLKNYPQPDISFLKRAKKSLRGDREDENLDIRIQIQVQEFARTESRRFEVPVERPCGSCLKPDGYTSFIKTTCNACSGLGFVSIQRGANRWRKTCDACMGDGMTSNARCPTCGGRRRVSETQEIEIRLPRSADLSRPICLKSLGHHSMDGKTRGDLWVQIAQTKR